MPYCRKTGQFVLCPPKNGTHTVQYVMQVHWQSCEHVGHVRYTEAVKRLTDERIDLDSVSWAMTVRNPLTRAFSAVNHYLHVKPHHDLDRAMDEAVDSPRALFQPQAWFLDGGEGKVKLFPFGGMPVIDWLGWPMEAKRPRKNVGQHKAGQREIQEHKRFEELMDRYQKDWLLFEAVTGL